MKKEVDTIIVGQGLAGTTLAWRLMEAGETVLVVDGNDPSSASRVAAGLMTPVTGKRMVCSPEFQEEWLSAVDFYRKIEKRFNERLLSISPMIRVFDEEQDRQRWLDRSHELGFVTAEPWSGHLEMDGEEKIGVSISPAGRLNVLRYLELSRNDFAAEGSLLERQLSFNGDVEFGQESYRIPEEDVQAKRLVLCQGAVWNEHFPKVPNNPAKGEIIEVTLEQSRIDRVVHRSIWIAPQQPTQAEEEESGSEGSRRLTVGATYDWRDLEKVATTKGLEDLQRKLSYIVEESPQIQDRLVGVRPTMKDRQPVLGEHPAYPGLWILNGLGSKGTLKAPQLTERLQHAMDGRAKIRESEGYQRLLPKDNQAQRPLTTVAQEKMAERIGPGDVVVDGTVGRGFDTAFLSQIVGPTGKVIGFDLQEEALEATSRRLRSLGAKNVELHHRGHEEAAQVLQDLGLNGAMLNLGFLPKSDKRVITTTQTTMKALAAILERLRDEGRMTILCYRGHEGGPEEYQAVEEWLTEHEEACFQRYESAVAKPIAPVLFVVDKNRERQEK